MNITSETEFVAPKKSTIINSGKGEWLTQMVPCLITQKLITAIYILPFDAEKTILVPNEEIEKNFIKLERDDTYVYTENYPNKKIEIAEFLVKKVNLKKLKKHFEDNQIMTTLIEKIETDSYKSKGNNSVCKILEYKNFIEGTVVDNSKLKRVGDPIYNRRARHSVPISKDYSREDYENCCSFPAPIGIREEDFALPSEQNKICIELLEQVFNSVNAPDCPKEIADELGLKINKNTHTCKWCGELFNIESINQNYCEKEHTLNLCHRDPIAGTKANNIYFGHCSCNREQGGYSELERLMQICRLSKNKEEYKNIIKKELFSDI